jgi:hypothetical protein
MCPESHQFPSSLSTFMTYGIASNNCLTVKFGRMNLSFHQPLFERYHEKERKNALLTFGDFFLIGFT